jgi:hypothetical protein
MEWSDIQTQWQTCYPTHTDKLEDFCDLLVCFIQRHRLFVLVFPSLEGLFNWSVQGTEGSLIGEIFIWTDPYWYRNIVFWYLNILMEVFVDNSF